MDQDIFDGSSSLSEREYELDAVMSSNGNGSGNGSRFTPVEDTTMSEDETNTTRSSMSSSVAMQTSYKKPISAGSASGSVSRRAPRVSTVAVKRKIVDDDTDMGWDDDKVRFIW